MAGKKKKVTVYKMPKAQEGMQMAEGAPQQEGGGQDQMQQLAMQVQQMLEQGAQPQEVVAQLIQGGVPPEVVAQIFVGLGMPQEEVVPMIEQIMQQMQGAQQQASPQEGMAPEGQPMMENGDEVLPLMATENLALNGQGLENAASFPWSRYQDSTSFPWYFYSRKSRDRLSRSERSDGASRAARQSPLEFCKYR